VAVGALQFNERTQHGFLLRQFLTSLEDALDRGNDVRNSLIQMRDGDGSQASHYAYATAKFEAKDGTGQLSDAVMKSIFDELDSCMSKLNTDGSVSSVNAAIVQIIAKLR
jgi:hypothetical protein